jgi:hypothetical protein
MELLDKYHLKHEVAASVLVNTACQQLVFAPTNAEAYVLAYGQMPETYQEWLAIVNFVRQKMDDHKSLSVALQLLHEAGKTILEQNR